MLRVHGKTTAFPWPNAMISGGSVCGGPSTDWDMWAEQDDWKIDLKEHPELEAYKEEITRIVNENVEHGCCGGCI